MQGILTALLALFLAAALPAAETAAPEVRADDAPEVTDPDLKEAAPAMREGADEPVGGYKPQGLKGLSGLSLAWDGLAVLGWTSWMTDSLAFKASMGGSYSDSAGGPVTNELSERVRLRLRLADLGSAGHAFVQASAGGRQKHSYQETRSQQTGYLKYDTSDVYTNAYSAGLDLGAEVFWPGSRQVSLEASAGLGALWTFTETRSETASQPGTAIPKTGSSSSTRAFEFGSRYNGITTALNVYF